MNYVGHGNLEQWGKPPALLKRGDVSHLTNTGSPSIFLGWGCHAAYHIDPADRALNTALLLAPHGGAVITLGSTGLDEAGVRD